MSIITLEVFASRSPVYYRLGGMGTLGGWGGTREHAGYGLGEHAGYVQGDHGDYGP